MLVGHERNIRYFERVLANGTLAHAYLFHGPEAVGKGTAALAVAAALLCAGKTRRLGGCGWPAQILPGKTWAGECEDCRSVKALAHPDLVVLAPDRLLVEESNRREIGIKNARELARLLALAPWSGRYRVAIIDGADALSREAQSALLKTVEEPSHRMVIILIAAAPELLLPTMRSRAVPIGFQTLSDSRLIPLLAGVPASERGELLALAAGRPGVAVRLAEDPAFRKELAASTERFARLLKRDGGAQAAFSEEVASDPAALPAFLTFLLDRLRANLHQHLGNGAATADTGRLIGIIAERRALALTTSVNRRLLADSVFFELAM